MGYTPYKMLGHELPGPKQRAPGKMSMEKTHINDKMVDGVSKKSGVLYKEGSGVGSSPNKFFGALGNLFSGKGGSSGGGGWADKIKEKVQAKKLEKQQGAFAAGGGADLEARVSALEEGSSGGGNAVLATAGGGPGTAMNKMIKAKKMWGGVSGGDGTGLGGTGLDQNIVPMQGGMPYKKKK